MTDQTGVMELEFVRHLINYFHFFVTYFIKKKIKDVSREFDKISGQYSYFASCVVGTRNILCFGEFFLDGRGHVLFLLKKKEKHTV